MKNLIIGLFVLGSFSAYAKETTLEVKVLRIEQTPQYAQGLVYEAPNFSEDLPTLLTGALNVEADLVKVQCWPVNLGKKPMNLIDSLYFNGDQDQVRLFSQDFHAISSALRAGGTTSIILKKVHVKRLRYIFSHWELIGIERT